MFPKIKREIGQAHYLSNYPRMVGLVTVHRYTKEKSSTRQNVIINDKKNNLLPFDENF